jgi:ankyrin repeat protein
MNANALTDLIKAGDNENLRKLLATTPSLAESLTEQGISILQFAAYYRNAGAVEIIRAYRYALNVFEAASVGAEDVVMNLVAERPALLNSWSADGFTPLGLACFFGHTELARQLLAKGGDPNIASNNAFKVTPLHSACAVSNYEIAAMLIQKGANVNAAQMQGVTPLHSAAHHGQTKLVKLLIENSANVNSKMENGQTPLAMALEKNFLETADVIRSSGGE